jgi:hypothetical protein
MKAVTTSTMRLFSLPHRSHILAWSLFVGSLALGNLHTQCTSAELVAIEMAYCILSFVGIFHCDKRKSTYIARGGIYRNADSFNLAAAFEHSLQFFLGDILRNALDIEARAFTVAAFAVASFSSFGSVLAAVTSPT